MYKKVTIEGFRGIKNLDIEDFQQVNLFVGKNNCGKTSILEALFLLTAPTNASLPSKTNIFRGYNVIDENSWRVFFNKLDIDSDIRISGELGKPKEKRNLIIKPHTKTVADTTIDKKVIDIKDSYSGSTPLIDGLILEYSFVKGNKKSKNIITYILVKDKDNGKGPIIEFTPPKDYKELLKGLFVNSLTLHYPNVAKRLDDIQVRKQTDPIIKILKQIEPSLDNLSSIGGVIYCDIGFDRMLPINVMGDGMVRLLGIISAISDTENGIVLIDEIENGFYYLSHEIVWDAIFKSAKEFNVQIFATTHSIECVKAFSSSYSKLYKNEDSIRLYRIDRKEDNFKAVSYNHKTLEASLDSEWEVR